MPRSTPHLVALVLVASSSTALAQAPAPEPAPAPPPPAEPAPAPAPAPAPPAAAAQPVEPAPPPKLAAGKQSPGAFFQPGPLIQIWFLLDHQNDRANSAGGEWLSQFRIRRAELSIKGDIVPEIVSYRVMIDPAKLLNFQKTDVPVQNQEPPPTTPGTVSVPQP